MSTGALACFTQLTVDPEQIVRSLAKGDWFDPILQPNHPLAAQVVDEAIELQRTGRISLNELTTIIMRWEPFADAGKHQSVLKVRSVPLHASFPLFERQPWRRRTQGLLPDQFDSFLGSLKELTAADLWVHEIIIPQSIVPLSELRMQLLVTLEMQGDIHPFLKRTENGDHAIVIPSLKVLQGYMNFIFGDQAIALEPELGLAPFEKVLGQVQQGKRTLGLAGPRTHIPNRIDRLDSNLTSFTWHDIFHAFKGAEMSKPYRLIFARALKLIESAYRTLQTGQHKLFVAPGVEIDTEKIYRRFALPSLRAQFADFLPTSTMASVLDPLPLGAQIIDDFGPIDSGHTPILVRDLVVHPDFYESLGVSPKTLLQELGPPAIRVAEAVRSMVNSGSQRSVD